MRGNYNNKMLQILLKFKCFFLIFLNNNCNFHLFKAVVTNQIYIRFIKSTLEVFALHVLTEKDRGSC